MPLEGYEAVAKNTGTHDRAACGSWNPGGLENRKHIAEQRCKEERPAFTDTGAAPPHQVACHFWDRPSPEGTAAQ